MLSDYSKITNPQTGRKISINSKLGKQILNKYVQTQYAGGIWDFIPFYGSKTDEIPSQVAKIYMQYSENFGITMNPDTILENVVTENVPIGRCNMSHPVLGPDARLNAMSKTLYRASKVTEYFHKLKDTDMDKFRSIKDGTTAVDVLNLSGNGGSHKSRDELKDIEPFWSEDDKGEYDPIVVVPCLVPTKKQKSYMHKWAIAQDVDLKSMLHYKKFRKLFGTCPCAPEVQDVHNPCTNKGIDKLGRVKCNLKSKLTDREDLKYLVLKGQGRILAFRMGLMNYNDDISETYTRNESKQYRLNLDKISITLSIGDTSVTHGTNYIELKEFYRNEGLFNDEHSGQLVSSTKYGDFIIQLDGYQHNEQQGFGRPISCSKVPTMNDIERWWLLNQYVSERDRAHKEYRGKSKICKKRYGNARDAPDGNTLEGWAFNTDCEDDDYYISDDQ